MTLNMKRCLPCEGGAKPLNETEITGLLGELDGWRFGLEGSNLHKTYKFAKFTDAIAFVNRMAELAEQEGHHPDFCVRYDAVDVSLSTHAIGGLSENDFILAAKLDPLA
jgi:4a-hydroxytetrahydrobiopterin dehydratase